MAAGDDPILGALFEAAPVAIAVADLAGVLVRTNPAYDKLLGYSADELVGRHVSDLVPAGDRAIERDLLARRTFAPSSGHRDKRFERKDGSVFWGRVRNGLIRDSDGMPRFITAMVVDITEHRRVADALATSEAQYRAIVRNMPNSAVLMIDRDLRFVAAGGPLLATILQLAKLSDIVGKTLEEIVSEETRAKLVPFYRAVVDGEEKHLQIRRHDRTYEVRGVPLPGAGDDRRALIFYYDVTARDATQRLLDSTIENMHDGVVLIDAKHRVLLANEAFCTLLDLPIDSVVGMTGHDVIAHLESRVADRSVLDNFIATGALEQEIALARPRRYVLRRRITPLEGAGAAYMIVWRDITAEHDLAVERDRQVFTDVLTGVGNRRAAERALDVEVSRMRRTQSRLCVALFDIDHFKQINDTRGHAAGDEVLRRVAETLAREARKTDVVARWGGEEFVAILPVGLDGAVIFCERARVAVAEIGNVTVSAGIAEVAADEPVSDAIERADRRLYEAKRGGRDRVVG